MSAALELQKSIYKRLNNGASFWVFDDVPQDQAKPFIVVGDDTLIEYDSDGKTGFECTITIHTWSDYQGMAEIKAMQSEIYDLLHRAEFSVIGYNLINCTFEFADSFLDSNGVTRHGVQRFRVILIKS